MPRVKGSQRAGAKPFDYVVTTTSLYVDDIDRIDRIVAAQRAAGKTRACRSSVIRDAAKLLERQLTKKPQPVENL